MCTLCLKFVLASNCNLSFYLYFLGCNRFKAFQLINIAFPNLSSFFQSYYIHKFLEVLQLYIVCRDNNSIIIRTAPYSFMRLMVSGILFVIFIIWKIAVYIFLQLIFTAFFIIIFTALTYCWQVLIVNCDCMHYNFCIFLNQIFHKLDI